MAHFKLYIDGTPWIEDYWTGGRYDVPNELFGDETGQARVAVVDGSFDHRGGAEFILLDYGNTRLTLEPIPDGQP